MQTDKLHDQTSDPTTSDPATPDYDECRRLACHQHPDRAHCDGPDQRAGCQCHNDQQDAEQDAEQPQPEQEQKPPMTLAEILAARTRKLDRERREAEALAQRTLEGQRQDDITAFTVRYEQIFPPELRDALAVTIAYDTTAEGYDDERRERGPFATFEHDTHLWMIRRVSYYGDTIWSLAGPNDYTANLGADSDYTSPAGPLLDAINHYPQWLAHKQQRDREQAETAEAKKRGEHLNREALPIFAYVAGDDPGHYGILHTESKVWLHIATPDTADERLAYERIDRLTAAIVDWSDTWLLINVDDDETQQRLIPIARVVSVQARA